MDLKGQKVEVYLYYSGKKQPKRINLPFSQFMVKKADNYYLLSDTDSNFLSINNGKFTMTDDLEKAIAFDMRKAKNNRWSCEYIDIQGKEHLSDYDVVMVELRTTSGMNENSSSSIVQQFVTPTVIDMTRPPVITTATIAPYVNSNPNNVPVVMGNNNIRVAQLMPLYPPSNNQIYALQNAGKTECEKRNSVWVNDTCLDCQNGEYPDRNNSRCVSCASNSHCGDKNGFCSGTTTPAGMECKYDSVSQTYSQDCNKSSSCSGKCSGSCGFWSVFGWNCKADNNGNYHCQLTNWFLLIVWILGFLLLIGLIIYAVMKFTPSSTMTSNTMTSNTMTEPILSKTITTTSVTNIPISQEIALGSILN